MLGEDKTFSLLSEALKDGPGDCDAFLTASRSADTRLANAEVIQDGIHTDVTVAVRVLSDGKLGTATTNDLTSDGLKTARKMALEIAQSNAGKPFECGFSRGREPTPDTPGAFDEATASLQMGDQTVCLAKPLEKARRAGLLMAGNFRSAVTELAAWNSLGLSRYTKLTRAEVNLIAHEGLEPSMNAGYAGDLSHRLGALDLDPLTEIAVDKALIGRNPLDIEPDTFDVILEPAALTELLEWMAYIGFSSSAVEENLSFMAGRLGETITGTNVTLIDDGLDPSGLMVPFDCEGTLKRRVALLKQGVAENHVHDRQSASKANTTSTGHALSAFSMGKGAEPTNLHFMPGTLNTTQLLERVQRGLWITRLHYVNGMLEPKRAVMTGLTRDGTFLIENGKITRGVRNLRFNDSILEAFERIDGVTSKRQTVPGWWSSAGSITAPTVLVRGLRFTGKTS